MNNEIVEFLDFKYEIVKNFCFNKNGIQVIETESSIEIYNDVFRTIPLFISFIDEKLIIFSNYINLNKLKLELQIDKVGFWETILFGFALGTRTLYKNIKQMPSASKIVINKKNKSFNIERYWDFHIEEDSSINTIDKAEKGLYELLDKSFSKLRSDKNYITGISGGMDSRITLAFLKKHIKKENLDLFTYGYSDKIYEYKYAKSIADNLNFVQPEFHELNKSTYLESINFLPYFTGGQISIDHSPLYSYLSKLQDTNKTLIATSYSEIIFSLKAEKSKTYEILSFETKLKNNTLVSEKIKEEIYKDISNIKMEYNKTNCFSNINEFLYTSEQHPKFHEYLTFLFKDKIDVINPYTNFEILKYVMSIPKQFKYRKKLQDRLLHNYFELRDKNVSSSRFEWGEAGGKFEWFRFKITNKINVLLRILTKGHIEILNPYQTEEQSRLIYKYFQKMINLELDSFLKKDLIDLKTYKHYKKLPLKSLGVIERFRILSLGKIINHD